MIKKYAPMRLLCVLVFCTSLMFVCPLEARADNSAAVFNVTIPTVLPVNVDSSGNISVAQDAQIVNNSNSAVKLDAVSVVPQNLWQLDTWETDYASALVNSKRFAMRFNNVPVPTNGAINVSEYPSIESGGSMDLTYDMKIAVQAENLTQTLANMLFTVSWDGHGALTGITVTTGPNQTEYIEGESFDSSGMVVTASYADGSTAVVTGWTVTNGSILPASQESVTVSYTENEIVQTASVPITVTRETAYALLYDTDRDGTGDTLVFQRGNTADPSYTLKQTYTGFETEAYSTERVPWYSQRANIRKVSFDGKIQPIYTQNWFNGFSNLTSVRNAENLDMSQVITVHSMFRDAVSLASLDLSSWDMSNVQTFNYLFYGCTVLSDLNISGWNTSSAKNMSYMFDGCKALTALDLSHFTTSKVTSMGYMFHLCTALRTLSLAGWNTSLVTYMACMFTGSSSLVTIYADSTFTTGAVTNDVNMFNGCTSLVGGNGTTYTPSKGKAYACIDAPGTPGYFTPITTIFFPI